MKGREIKEKKGKEMKEIMLCKIGGERKKKK